MCVRNRRINRISSSKQEFILFSEFNAHLLGVNGVVANLHGSHRGVLAFSWVSEILFISAEYNGQQLFSLKGTSPETHSVTPLRYNVSHNEFGVYRPLFIIVPAGCKTRLIPRFYHLRPSAVQYQALNTEATVITLITVFTRKNIYIVIIFWFITLRLYVYASFYLL